MMRGPLNVKFKKGSSCILNEINQVMNINHCSRSKEICSLVSSAAALHILWIHTLYLWGGGFEFRLKLWLPCLRFVMVCISPSSKCWDSTLIMTCPLLSDSSFVLHRMPTILKSFVKEHRG